MEKGDRRMPSLISLEYIAGLFDGEGCIYASRAKYYALCVSMGNTYKPILDKMVVMFGGMVRTKRNYSKNVQPCYEWILNGAFQIFEFLTTIRPFLIIKEPQAWLALESLSQRTSYTGHNRLSPEEFVLRKGFSLALQQAKRNT